MTSIVIKINPRNPEPAKIKQAVHILKRGGLVAFPTDTVYGLGADARNLRAVKKIFAVKKRPLSNPLPILIAKKSDLKKYTLGTSKKIKKITDKFWPGPLTITLEKKKIISDVVTAGKKTVGIRVPKNPVALALIKTLGRPIYLWFDNAKKEAVKMLLFTVVNLFAILLAALLVNIFVR